MSCPIVGCIYNCMLAFLEDEATKNPPYLNPMHNLTPRSINLHAINFEKWKKRR